MTLFRLLAKKIFGPYLPYVQPAKAAKWMSIMRMTYFFSAGSLLLLFNKYGSTLEQETLESGIPLIKDHSENLRRIREGSADAGVIYEYSPGKGLRVTDVNKEEYYQQLEKEAYERAKQAQEKALAEGRELPRDAIRLV